MILRLVLLGSSYGKVHLKNTILIVLPIYLTFPSVKIYKGM